jgi:membrane associated rhomboid family serine protease
MSRTAFSIPFLYIVLILLGFSLQAVLPEITSVFGLYPRNEGHLIGIVTTVFLHGDIGHLASNLLPLAACLFGLFFFYKGIALRVTILCHFFTGVLMWIFARPSFHIGASGLAYALVFFILVSGFMRKNKRLKVLAFMILVFQNGLIWGVFPQGNNISWESHLLGACVGLVLAFIYRHKGPAPDRPVLWDEESSDEDEYEQLLR